MSSASESSRGLAQPVDGESSSALDLGARFGLFEQLRVFVQSTACTESVASFRLELQGGPGRHARLSSL